MSKVDLKLDWCSYQAAKYAVEHWHYSGHLSAGKNVYLGVWEDGQFIGVVVFGRGANIHIGSTFRLTQLDICELTRVALNAHANPVSRIVGIAIRMLLKQSSGLRMIVSFADMRQGHNGAIYQASNWIYTGLTSVNSEYWCRGKWVHRRTASSVLGTIKGVPHRVIPAKHRYLYPLDAEMRERILPLAQPYPKRVKDSSEPAAIHAAEGGAAPTHTLQEPMFPMSDRLKGLT